MTNLLLKNKTERFKWLQQQLCNGEERESERDGLRLRRRILRIYSALYSFPCFNSKFTELIVNNTPVFFIVHLIYVYIYEIGYCYEDRR